MPAHRRRRHKHKPRVRWYVGVVENLLSGRRVQVRVHRVLLTMTYVSGFSPVVGHTIRVSKTGNKWAAVGPVSDGDVTIPAGDDAPDLPTSGTHGPLRPIYAGTWTGSRWRAGQLTQGVRLDEDQIGCAFYGSGPRVKLRQPVGAVRLRLRGADPRMIGPITLRAVAERSRPVGAPTLVGGVLATATLAGTDLVTVTLGATAGAALVAGTWGGFAIYDTAATDTLAVGLDADSLTLLMDWS